MQELIAVGIGILSYMLFVHILRRRYSEEAAVQRRLADIEKRGGRSFQSGRKEMLEQPFFERTVRPILERIGASMRRISGNRRKEEKDLKTKQALYQSGSTMTVSEYNALRVSITVVTAVVMGVLAFMLDMPLTNKLLFILLGVTAPYILMRYAMSGKIAKRKEAIEHQLPEVLDLMSVSVEAGLGFEQAMLYIMNNMEGPVVDELAITYREITLGRSRRDAFVLFGERCGTDSAKSFTNALVQATELGISMKVLLQTQSEAMRKHRKRLVEAQAMKVSTKLLFPLVFFIFPVMFIVLLGPAMMNLIGNI